MTDKYLNSTGLARVWSRACRLFSARQYVDDVAKEILGVSVHGVYYGLGDRPVTLYQNASVARMWIDGTRLTPASSHVFGDEGLHQVWLKLTNPLAIPIQAFSGLNVQFAIVGSSVRDIAEGAFYLCRELQVVVLPAGIANIGLSSFQDCASLIEFVCMASTPPTVDQDAFSGINREAILFVPEESVEDYIDAGWKVFFSEILSVDKWNRIPY